MAYVITQACCNDASCVPTCPVQCIRPRPGDPEFSHTEQLYIDPNSCIDCGACMDACPVEAIHPDFDMPHAYSVFEEINAEYFVAHPLSGAGVPSFIRRRLPEHHPELRVAVIGAGPAGCYATGLLTEIPGVSVSLFDRLPTPFGLIRAGVAPDHAKTKKIAGRFGEYLRHPNVSCFFNVEIGRDISLEEVSSRHHALIWAGGASGSRELRIPGEDTPGVYAARDFVAWYNGHPDFADRSFDLSGESAVVVGNGNVALDVARTVLLPSSVLERTDISEVALRALAAAKIREVIVVGRRGPEHAAYSLSELQSLSETEGLSIRVEREQIDAAADHGRRHQLLVRACEAGVESDRVIRLRYGLEPLSIEGTEHVQSITFRRDNGSLETIPTTAVFRAIGYRGCEVAGLPFDPLTGTVPNDAGRVVDPRYNEHIPGMYVTGWIKRGPRGIIGTNKVDAGETIDGLLLDLSAERLTAPSNDIESLVTLIKDRDIQLVDKTGWQRIDAAEKARGQEQHRPRRKFLTIDELLDAALERA